MNAHEHYREAERLLEHAASLTVAADASHFLRTAQVHATLALAAAHGAGHPPIRKEGA